MCFKNKIICLIFSCLLVVNTAFALLPDEKNTINVYKNTADSVVFVHRYQRIINNAMQIFDVPAGAGSGFVWDKQGHIVTNYHVIKGSKHLAISIGNLNSKVSIVGAEPRKDIAVLKVHSTKVLNRIAKQAKLKLANSHHLVVGQKVIAIGNPFGLDHSLSTGVISALGRQVPGIVGTLYDMIQTDAAINPGNSGGPLLDSQGRVIGMNTAIYSKTGSSAGVGFAVPTEDIERIVNQIIKHGRVILAGIGVQRIEPSIAKYLGVNQGILIERVLANSPAAQAKLRGTYRDGFGRFHLGDIIIAINGHPTKKYDDMYELMSDIKVGNPITLTLIRAKRKIRVKLTTIDIAQRR